MKEAWGFISHELRSHPVIYLLLFIVFSAGVWFRVAHLDVRLGFYYDQGRDALEVQKILHGHLTLIGPTTGIDGLFHGPLYYYFLTPLYFLTGGNPAHVAVVMGFFNSLAIFAIFAVAALCMNRIAGLVAAFLFAFSFETVTFSRWFSNPSPQMIFSILGILALWLLTQKKSWGLPLLAFAIAFGFQFEAVSLITFIPAALVVLLWQRKALAQFLKKRDLVASLVFALFGIGPYLLFELRHQFLMTRALVRLLFHESGFGLSLWQVAAQRGSFYLDVYNNLLLRNREQTLLLLIILSTVIVFLWVRDRLSSAWKVLIVWTLSPLIVLLFYQGNNGYVWGYYLSPTLPAVILLLSGLAGLLWKSAGGKVVVLLFLVIFTRVHQPILAVYTGPLAEYGPETILFGNQLRAIDWIYQDAGGEPFNVDVYVPPVVPYAYDYLIPWRGQKQYQTQPVAETVRLLYTLSEVDSPHPERLSAWLARQAVIAPRVEKEASFGGITVARRRRNT